MNHISLPEAIAMFVAVMLALALVSFLAYGKMTQGGFPTERKRQILVSLWLLVLGLIALLFALRAVGGGSVVGGTPGEGIWLGLKPRQMLAMATAVALLIVGYVRIRSILQPLEADEPLAPPPAATGHEADRDT